MKGVYVLEGVNGSGKTSIVKVLKEIMPSFSKFDGIINEFLKEPDSIGYELLKDKSSNDYQRMMAMFTNRIVHSRRIKTLGENYRVFIDRYTPSTFAYQCGIGDVSKTTFWDLYKNLDLVIPDIYFLIDVPTDVAVERISNRDKKELSGDEITDIDLIRMKYKEFFRDFKYNIYNEERNGNRVITVDGTRPVVVSAISIINDIWENENKSQ